MVSQRILAELERIEREHAIRILYAVESGSRAWGFESQDSDYDVRFLYLHHPDWYLSVRDQRDVIEEMHSDRLDFSGWELRKALRLLRKSNPPLNEWLRSPHVYQEVREFASELRILSVEYYSANRCFMHYLHMAEGNTRDYFTGESVPHKKYLYVLRPLLACLWIERGLGPVPMEFMKLVDVLTDGGALRTAIADLVERKRHGMEKELGPKIEEIQSLIETELPRLRQRQLDSADLPDEEGLDRFFRSCLSRYAPQG